jgi:hypothetical protein
MFVRRSAFALAALLLAVPASAQQYWLPNGPGGTTFNNPNGSLLGTMNEHLLQRHMMQRQYGGGGGNGQSGAAPAASGAAQSADPSFRLTNAGRQTVREVYVSSSNDGGWGPDRLGAEVLQPGGRMVIRLPTGQCVNDLRVVFTDGRAQERRQVNTCALTDMSVQ